MEDIIKAIQVLNEGIASLKDPLSELIYSTTRSNRLLEKQNELLSQVKSQLQLNTARLDLLQLAVSSSLEDPAIEAVYETLKGNEHE